MHVEKQVYYPEICSLGLKLGEEVNDQIRLNSFEVLFNT